VLKHCAANRKRRLSALRNVGPYIIYSTLKFLAVQGAPYIYDVSRLRVNGISVVCLAVTAAGWLPYRASVVGLIGQKKPSPLTL
jgi:hypothetical protein